MRPNIVKMNLITQKEGPIFAKTSMPVKYFKATAKINSLETFLIDTIRENLSFILLYTKAIYTEKEIIIFNDDMFLAVSITSAKIVVLQMKKSRKYNILTV